MLVMTSRQKVWTLRIVSIPVLLLLPFACGLVAAAIGERLLANSYPLGEAMTGMVAGFVAMIVLSPWTVFARQDAGLKKRVRVLIGIGAFEIIGLPLVLAISALSDSLLRAKAYDRASLKLDPIVKPTVDVSGTWNGSWTDPRKEFTETITLNLTQSQNSVTGSIVDERGGEWRIIEGVVSDNQVNLFYDREFPAWPGAGATLRGVITSNSITGNYYGHERPRRGWASSGPWVVTRASREQTNSVQNSAK
jgi:hypothetical protein